MIIQPNQQEYLTWYKTFSRVIILVFFKYKDDSNYVSVVTQDFEHTAKLETIDVGFDYLVNLTAAPNPSNIVYYEVVIYEIGGTEPDYGPSYERLRKKYTVDCNHYENTRDYYFLNRFGALEVFRASGVHSTDLQTKREECVSLHCFNEIKLKGVNHQYKHQSKNLITGRSGIQLSQEELFWLQDFMHSDYVWLLDENSSWPNNLCPIKLTEKKFKVSQDKRTIHELKFKYELTINPVDYQ